MKISKSLINGGFLKAIAIIIILAITNKTIAQKVVFNQEFKLRNNVITDKMPFAGMVFDSASMQRLLISNNMKNMVIYLLDKDWKIIKQFDYDVVKNSNLCQSLFRSIAVKKNGNVWTLITSPTFRDTWTKETIDFDKNTLTVGESYLDEKEMVDSKNFVDGNLNTCMYLKKGEKDVIYFTSIDKNFVVKNTSININSSVPLNKPKKINAVDVFSNLAPFITSDKEQNYALVMSKVLLYRIDTEYALVLMSEEDGVAEVSFYNKETGKKSRENTFSLESLWSDDEKKDKKNSIALIYDQKLWMLNTSKNWGMLGVFDLNTKKILYNFKYNDKQEADVLNYPPTMYETNPGLILNLSKNKEKITEISMNKFCKELYKYTTVLAVLGGNENYYIVKLGNFDFKLINTSSGRDYQVGSTRYFKSPGYESFADFYITTTAGLFLDKTTLKQSAKKSTWAEVNDKNVSSSYKKIKDNGEDQECYNKRAIRLGSYKTNTSNFVIYFYEKEMRIMEQY